MKRRRARRNPIPSDPSLMIDGKPIGRRSDSFEYLGWSTINQKGMRISVGDPSRNDVYYIRTTDSGIVYAGKMLPYISVRAAGSWDLLVWNHEERSWVFVRERQLFRGITILGVLPMGKNLTKTNRPRHQIAIVLKKHADGRDTIDIYRVGGK